MSGASPSVAGDLAVFNNATGQVISDTGIAAATLVSGPAGAVLYDIAIFSTTSGKSLMDSKVLADPTTGGLTSVSGIYRDMLAGITRLRSGWPNRTDSSMSFTDGTRVFQIAPTGSAFTFYIGNVPHTFSSPQAITISASVGLHFIWFDVTGTLVDSLVAFDMSAPIALVSTIYWNGTNGLLNEERHGMVMDWADHRYLHTTVGTRYESGLTGTFLAANTFTVTAGQIDDEDIQIPIAQQTTCRVFYRIAGPGQFTFTAVGTGFMVLAGARLQYDNAGVLTNVPVGDYVAYFVFATDNIANPIFVIMGQRVDTSLANAQANALPSTLDLETLPSAEMKLIFVVYIQQPNATTQVISAVVDYRGSSSLPITNYVPTAHSSLTGLIAPADDHTQYVLDGGATSTSGHLAMYTDTSGRTVNDSGLLTASLKYDYINFDESNFVVYTPLSQGGTGAELSTEQLSNGIERVIYTFDHSHLQQVFFSADMPPEWDGGNVTFEMFWETADANLNTFKANIYGARIAAGTTSNVALTTLLVSITDTNTGAGFRNESAETTPFSITGSGNHIDFMMNRDYVSDTIVSLVKMFRFRMKYGRK